MRRDFRKNSGKVRYAHPIIGNWDTGLNYPADTVVQLAAGNHAASTLEGKRICRKFLCRREFIQSANEGEIQLAATMFLKHSRNLHPPDILARSVMGTGFKYQNLIALF